MTQTPKTYGALSYPEGRTIEVSSGHEEWTLWAQNMLQAAPDMLAALQSSKEWLEKLRDLHQARADKQTAWPMPGMDARYREVCAAIAKATA